MKLRKALPVVFGVACLCLFLSGCTPLARGSLDSLRQVFSSGSLRVDEAALNADYAYMRADIAGNKLLMGRGRTSDQGAETWYSALNQVLILRNGLLERTVGLPVDVHAVRYPSSHPLSQGGGLQLPVTFVREADRPGLSPEVSEYRLEDCGFRRIAPWGREQGVRCLREVLLSSNARRPLPGNTYWLEPESGAWVQSLQWISPEWPVLLKPWSGSPPVVASAVSLVSLQPGGRHDLTVTEPVRLSDLLLQYPLAQDWWLGAAWLARDQESRQHQARRGVLYDLDQALARTRQPAARVRMQRFRDRLAAMPVTGRKLLPPLQARWLQVNPQQNPVLDIGDRLIRFAQPPRHVLVTGNVLQDCRLSVVGGATVLQVLRACLVGESLPDVVQVIDPSGQVSSVAVALWNRADRSILAGSVLVVPFPSLAKFSGNAGADLDLAHWLSSQPDLLVPEALTR